MTMPELPLQSVLANARRCCGCVQAASSGKFPPPPGGVRAGWQKQPKALARLQRIPATMRGSRWQCRIGGRATLRGAQAFLRHLAAFVLDGGAVVLLRIERLDLRVVLLLARADLAGRR